MLLALLFWVIPVEANEPCWQICSDVRDHIIQQRKAMLSEYYRAAERMGYIEGDTIKSDDFFPAELTTTRALIQLSQEDEKRKIDSQVMMRLRGKCMSNVAEKGARLGEVIGVVYAAKTMPQIEKLILTCN